jgi:hypothetical protein
MSKPIDMNEALPAIETVGLRAVTGGNGFGGDDGTGGTDTTIYGNGSYSYVPSRFRNMPWVFGY